MYQHDADGQKRTPLNPDFPHLIIVEGRDDGEFYEKMCQLAGVADKIEIRSVGDNSGTAFLRAIRFLKEVGSHLQTIAIIRDAEDNPAGSWESARDCLNRALLPSPTQSGILSSEQDGRRTAALIVPIGKPGSVETICWASLDPHPLTACVEDFLACSWANDPGSKSTTQALMDKARIRALLAVGPSSPRPLDPEKRFIHAIREDFWDWNHEAFAPIIDFMKTVARV